MIFCFSGTGNSRWIADELARNLNDNVVMISDAGNAYNIASGERVVWVFPIYSWGLPPVVRRFVRSITLNQNSHDSAHFMVCSCGDDIGLAHKQWRKEINKRGWRVQATYSVIMPNTYTLMKGFDVDSQDIVVSKLKNASGRVSEISDRIKSGEKADDVVKGSWSWVKTYLIYPYFVRFCMSPKPFHVTECCIGCGKCAKECPLKNLTMTERRPQWGINCALCLRCYHTCPQHAVEYGKETKYKGQYLFSKVDK